MVHPDLIFAGPRGGPSLRIMRIVVMQRSAEKRVAVAFVPREQFATTQRCLMVDVTVVVPVFNRQSLVSMHLMQSPHKHVCHGKSSSMMVRRMRPSQQLHDGWRNMDPVRQRAVAGVFVSTRGLSKRRRQPGNLV